MNYAGAGSSKYFIAFTCQLRCQLHKSRHFRNAHVLLLDQITSLHFEKMNAATRSIHFAGSCSRFKTLLGFQKCRVNLFTIHVPSKNPRHYITQHGHNSVPVFFSSRR
ncbi:hypothetical protein V7S43_003513 [Phytophthora oleae]|uniref:Uncharacterized protein n=1 Tax=Phytophthora oleae TaxID=2107226 RepID=A0ABD3FXD9_9STRA